MTREQVIKKFKGLYVEYSRTYSYEKRTYSYVIIKKHKKIHENTEFVDENFDLCYQ